MSGVIWLILSTIRGNKSDSGEPIFLKPNRKKTVISYGAAVSYGVINKIANYLLVIALVYVDASVQYPMVTGGTMIVSTLISFLGDNKPCKSEIASVIVSFAAMIVLFIIPI